MSKRNFVVLVVFLAAANLCYGQLRRLSPDLAGRDSQAPVNVIIRYQRPLEQRHIDAVVRRGGHALRRLDLVNGAAYSVPANALAELANDPDVAYISPDRPVHAALSASTQLPQDYKLQAVNANVAQINGFNGNDIGIAVIDSGITNRPDFRESAYSSAAIAASNQFRIVHSENLINGGSTDDSYGHGTHVAGILGGNGAMSFGVYSGVAPAANIINLVALDNTGSGTDSTVIAAIQRAVQLQQRYNIEVINLSLGRPVMESYTQDPLCQAVEAAWNAGIVVVVAAGNDGRDNSQGTEGYATITAPGNDPYVITVGAMKTENTATRSDDLIASYSSKGPTLLDHVVKPDLVAPGNLIISVLGDGTLPQEYPQSVVDTNYFMLSGTSMAAPMVSGAAAMLLQQNPNLTPDQVKARLMATAWKNFPVSSTATDPTTGITYTSYYDIFTVGAGYLDVWAALNSGALANGSAASPIATYNSTDGSVTLSNLSGQSVIWGTSLIWGTSVIWGTSAVSGDSLIWGTSVIWGTSAPSNLSIIWGTSLIWGTSVPTGQTSLVAIDGEQ
ncbi:MAG TPA: S8 family peptidase [Bryobacteraceae bacterium]|nr:S8 family peptidase [Bryobacteraceae bacterium]HUO30033.1 S8 family peptidase [Bryobacteraceae bacterium]